MNKIRFVLILALLTTIGITGTLLYNHYESSNNATSQHSDNISKSKPLEEANINNIEAQENQNTKPDDINDNNKKYTLTIWSVSSGKTTCTVNITAPDGGKIEKYESNNMGESQAFILNDLKIIFGPAEHTLYKPMHVSEYLSIRNPNIQNLYMATYDNKETENIIYDQQECNQSIQKVAAPCVFPHTLSKTEENKKHMISAVLESGDKKQAATIMATLDFNYTTTNNN